MNRGRLGISHAFEIALEQRDRAGHGLDAAPVGPDLGRGQAMAEDLAREPLDFRNREFRHDLTFGCAVDVPDRRER